MFMIFVRTSPEQWTGCLGNSAYIKLHVIDRKCIILPFDPKDVVGESLLLGDCIKDPNQVLLPHLSGNHECVQYVSNTGDG